MHRYVAWICKAEDMVLAEERTTEADRVKIMEVTSNWRSPVYWQLPF